MLGTWNAGTLRSRSLPSWSRTAHLASPWPLICRPMAIPFSCAMVPGDLKGPWKSVSSGLMEMLAPKSQMMGLVLALGPRDSRMRAGPCWAMWSGVEWLARWTCNRIMLAAARWRVVRGAMANGFGEWAAGTGQYFAVRCDGRRGLGTHGGRNRMFLLLFSPFQPVLGVKMASLEMTQCCPWWAYRAC